MRILVLLIKYTLMITIGLSLIGLITREVLLFWGTQQVKIHQNRLGVIAGVRLNNAYDDQCQDKGSGRAGSVVRSVQLRFTSDTEYQVEVICEFFSNDPIIVDTYKLPPFVKKVKGQSGFIHSTTDTSGIVLEVFHRRTSLILDKGKFRIAQGTSTITGTQPVATCGGFGYACCNAETQIGEGELFTKASDCPKDCFPLCVSRPTVLKFTTDPNPDLKTRTVILSKGAPITFYFFTDPGKSGTATTQLQFGDTQTQDFTVQDGSYTHQYACAQAECRYEAVVVVTDPTGTASVPTPISKISIVVR